MNDSGLIKTTKFSNPRYIGDPINAIKIFNDKEVDELVLLDVDATVLGKSPNYDLIKNIASECFMPLAYGGGIKSIDEAKKIFKLGIEKVIINAAAVKNPSLIKELSSIYGSQSVVVSIDYKKNRWGKCKVYIYRGKTCTNFDPVEFAIKMEEFGAGELLCTSINNEGLMKGYENNISLKISDSVRIPVIINGGAGSINDIADVVNNSSISAAAVGSLFVYSGKTRAVLINYFSRKEMNTKLI